MRVSHLIFGFHYGRDMVVGSSLCGKRQAGVCAISSTRNVSLALEGCLAGACRNGRHANAASEAALNISDRCDAHAGTGLSGLPAPL